MFFWAFFSIPYFLVRFLGQLLSGNLERLLFGLFGERQDGCGGGGEEGEGWVLGWSFLRKF